MVHTFNAEVVRVRNRAKRCGAMCDVVQAHSASTEWRDRQVRIETLQASLAEQEAWCKDQALVVRLRMAVLL